MRAVCRLMVDKITTVPKTKIRARVGRLADEDMVRLNRAVLVFVDTAAPASREQLEWSYRDLKQLLAYLCAPPTRHAFLLFCQQRSGGRIH